MDETVTAVHKTQSHKVTQTLIALKPMGKGRGPRAQKAPLKEIAARKREIASATGPQRAMPPRRSESPLNLGMLNGVRVVLSDVDGGSDVSDVDSDAYPKKQLPSVAAYKGSPSVGCLLKPNGRPTLSRFVAPSLLLRASARHRRRARDGASDAGLANASQA